MTHDDNTGNYKHGPRKPEKSESAAYFSILPASVRYDNNLSASEKVFYCEITALANIEGFCWATNAYFSQLYNVRAETISRWISNLANKKYIYIKRDKAKRCLYPNCNKLHKKALDR